MNRAKWNVSAGAILLFALMYFFDGSGLVSAAIPAIAAHELGHLLPLRLLHHPPRRVSVSLFGLEIDYAGRLEGRQAVFCLAAGPLCGLAYAVLSCTLGGAFWRMSGAVSFLLTAFNLLPILPLDGGRLMAAVTDELFSKRLSRAAALILVLGGAGVFLLTHSLSLLLMGAWLTVCNFRTR